MRCPRCLNGFVMATYLDTDYEDIFCIQCAWRYHPPEPVTTPMRQHGTCLCGNAIRSDRLDVCPTCHCARIKQGRLAAAQERMAI